MHLRRSPYKYIYWTMVTLWLIIGIHVAYLYLSFASPTSGGKGGTFVEATFDPVSYLPYVTTNDSDKFYQSLLFNGCVYPTVSGTNIGYREEICEVDTSDYQQFTVDVLPGHTWSDGLPVTLADVYFTYSTLLKDNFWNLEWLEPYATVDVAVIDDKIRVTFPAPSIDNMIFFTNFILPEHLLANQPIDTYITTFADQPIGSNCARIKPPENDTSSTIFDLSKCDEAYLKFYQVKQFDDRDEAATYMSSSTNPVDLVIDTQGYEGYEANEVVLNKFLTLFFNTQSELLDNDLRQRVAYWLTRQLDDADTGLYIADRFLFDAIGQEALSSGYLEEALTIGDNTADDQPVKELNELPDTLNFTADDADQEFTLAASIPDKRTLRFRFPEVYEKVSVIHNGSAEYFPESYNATTKSTYYNLNPTFRNITKGENTYEINGYLADDTIEKFTLVIHYLTEPVIEAEQATATAEAVFNQISILYFENETTTELVETIATVLDREGLTDYFTFDRYDDPDLFAGKIQSKDYDIIIRTIDMGLRRDISNLFQSSIPNINPSLYVNDELTTAINEYFLTDSPRLKSIAKQTIDGLYGSTTPLVILGKELGTIHIRSQLRFPYPYRLYVLGWRKDFINGIRLFRHITIDWDKVLDWENFQTFLKNS